MLVVVNAAQEVFRAARARASALAEGDGERLAALLHSDFRWTSHLGETFSRHEYVERNTRGQTSWKSQELDDANVVVAGETAVLFAEVTDVILTQGRHRRERCHLKPSSGAPGLAQHGSVRR